MKKSELLKMIVDLQERVRKLEEKQVSVQPQSNPGQTIFQPFIQTIDYGCVSGGIHEYPSPWNGIFPPNCTKCGKSSQNWNVITCTATGTNIDDNSMPDNIQAQRLK
jgi:hypothetical protein